MVPRDQAWLRCSLTLREFIEALIYPRPGSNGAGMAEVFFLTLREFIEALIYSRHGSKGLGMAEVLFNS